jgi:3-hydroxy acid dehydrogenase/malonic semialdehyde reductase
VTDLNAMTVFVTGATAGFGAAIARRFAAAGSKLVLAARRMERLGALKSELPVPTHIIALDVRDREEVEQAIGALPDEFSGVDILINNAGLSLGLEPAHEADLDDWDAMVDTNVKGLMYCTRLLLPSMIKRNRGHIVNIGSVAGTYPYRGGNVYGATKAFVRQFSLNLRSDLLGTRIRVTDVEPGLAKTEFSLVRFKGDAQRAEAVYIGTEPITAGDLAEIVFWICTLPAHLNINRIEVMPICQSFSMFDIDRQKC